MSDRLERLWYPKGPESLGRKALLSPLAFASWAYGAAVGVRNALYDKDALKRRRVDGLRVISVGNLNVGGAGKTPAVIFLAQLALSRGLRVAVLSRGYGRAETDDRVVTAESTARQVGDEPWLLFRRCPGCVVLVGTDRARLAETALHEHGAQLAILDDGMQHRRLERDAELVVVDEAAGFGNGQLLPRGPLREPRGSLSRASLIWLRLADGEHAELPSFQAPIVRVRHQVAGVRAPSGALQPADVLARRPLVAFSGLARPGGFHQTLEALGAKLVATRAFGDHHAFSPGELQELRAAAQAQGAELVTTEKDLARLPEGFPVWVVRIEVQIVSGSEHLEAALGLAL